MWIYHSIPNSFFFFFFFFFFFEKKKKKKSRNKKKCKEEPPICELSCAVKHPECFFSFVYFFLFWLLFFFFEHSLDKCDAVLNPFRV